jgi:predicted RNA polymerase sigma factor
MRSGVKHVLPRSQRQTASSSLIAQLDKAARAPADKLRAAIVVAEVDGAESAIKRLDKLERDPNLTEPLHRDAGRCARFTVARTSRDGEAATTQEFQPPRKSRIGAFHHAKLSTTRDTQQREASIDPEARDELIRRHGWFGGWR